MDTTTAVVTEAQQQQYRDEGFFVLERVLSDQQLELLRRFAQEGMDHIDARMDDAGAPTIAASATSPTA